MTGDGHGILETGGTETCIESRSQVWHPKACNVHAASLAHMCGYSKCIPPDSTHFAIHWHCKVDPRVKNDSAQGLGYSRTALVVAGSVVLTTFAHSKVRNVK